MLGQLFNLQILKHSAYVARASQQYKLLLPVEAQRGEIYMQDLSSGEEVPLVINQPIYDFYVVPRNVDDPAAAALILNRIVGGGAERYLSMLRKSDDPYEIISRALPAADKTRLEKSLIAAKFSSNSYGFDESWKRYYLAGDLNGQFTGFVGFGPDGQTRIGQYGIEEYFDRQLVGQPGMIIGEKDATGRPMAIGQRTVKDAVNGRDIILTIDQNIQYKTCLLLDKYVKDFGAVGGTVVIMSPVDGSILALCGNPRFDPNEYSESPVQNFMNPAVNTNFEPGSIFKMITMAAALDVGAVTPNTTFEDKGVEVIDGYRINNSDGQAHGIQTMTDFLDKSLNTGAIFAVRKTGAGQFLKYVENFGFGKLTGIELAGEEEGDISPLRTGREIYVATTSFGQGITVTAMQLVTAYTALARGGELIKPHIVKAIKNGDQAETFGLTKAGVVMSPAAAEELTTMLVSVVENGYSKKARVPGYLMAAKTGTAQIPNVDKKGYSDDTIHSIVGFGPVGRGVPLFTIMARLDKVKKVRFCADSAAPLFGEIARFLLDYFEVPPNP